MNYLFGDYVSPLIGMVLIVSIVCDLIANVFRGKQVKGSSAALVLTAVGLFVLLFATSRGDLAAQVAGIAIISGIAMALFLKISELVWVRNNRAG